MTADPVNILSPDEGRAVGLAAATLRSILELDTDFSVGFSVPLCTTVRNQHGVLTELAWDLGGYQAQHLGYHSRNFGHEQLDLAPEPVNRALTSALGVLVSVVRRQGENAAAFDVDLCVRLSEAIRIVLCMDDRNSYVFAKAVDNPGMFDLSST